MRPDHAGNPTDGVPGDLRGPEFRRALYEYERETAGSDAILIAIGTTARAYVLVGAAALAIFGVFFFYWSRTESGQEKVDAVRMRTPVLGNIWIKYQVAQFARVLSTLLTGGIPLVQGLETAADSLGTALLRKSLEKAGSRCAKDSLSPARSPRSVSPRSPST